MGGRSEVIPADSIPLLTDLKGTGDLTLMTGDLTTSCLSLTGAGEADLTPSFNVGDLTLSAGNSSILSV